MKSLVAAVSAATAIIVLTGCGKHEKPNFIYMPDMVYSPALKAQKDAPYTMLRPVKGTVPRGFEPYHYATDPDGAGRDMKNTLRPTMKVLQRGQVMFNTYCMVCHGPNGEGDGTIVPRYPRPPSLQSDKVRGWTDGRIYHQITAGMGLMPSYASQIAQQDRWAIIHYVRALQRAKHPTPDDLKAAEIEAGK